MVPFLLVSLNDLDLHQVDPWCLLRHRRIRHEIRALVAFLAPRLVVAHNELGVAAVGLDRAVEEVVARPEDRIRLPRRPNPRRTLVQ